MDGALGNLLLQSALQIFLDGLPGRELPHATIRLDKADATVIDSDQENALRLLHLLEGTVRPELHQRPDLLIGLQGHTLLGGNGRCDAIVVIDYLNLMLRYQPS